MPQGRPQRDINISAGKDSLNGENKQFLKWKWKHQWMFPSDGAFNTYDIYSSIRKPSKQLHDEGLEVIKRTWDSGHSQGACSSGFCSELRGPVVQYAAWPEAVSILREWPWVCSSVALEWHRVLLQFRCTFPPLSWGQLDWAIGYMPWPTSNVTCSICADISAVYGVPMGHRSHPTEPNGECSYTLFFHPVILWSTLAPTCPPQSCIWYLCVNHPLLP